MSDQPFSITEQLVAATGEQVLQIMNGEEGNLTLRLTVGNHIMHLTALATIFKSMEEILAGCESAIREHNGQNEQESMQWGIYDMGISRGETTSDFIFRICPLDTEIIQEKNDQTTDSQRAEADGDA